MEVIVVSFCFVYDYYGMCEWLQLNFLVYLLCLENSSKLECLDTIMFLIYFAE